MPVQFQFKGPWNCLAKRKTIKPSHRQKWIPTDVSVVSDIILNDIKLNILLSSHPTYTEKSIKISQWVHHFRPTPRNQSKSGNRFSMMLLTLRQASTHSHTTDAKRYALPRALAIALNIIYKVGVKYLYTPRVILHMLISQKWGVSHHPNSMNVYRANPFPAFEIVRLCPRLGKCLPIHVYWNGISYWKHIKIKRFAVLYKLHF